MSCSRAQAGGGKTPDVGSMSIEENADDAAMSMREDSTGDKEPEKEEDEEEEEVDEIGTRTKSQVGARAHGHTHARAFPPSHPILPDAAEPEPAGISITSTHCSPLHPPRSS